MRLSSNKGYIQGELNLVDIHDQFDTLISSDGNTWMCCDGKHPRYAVMVTFQISIISLTPG